jgi:RES domain-containing protein
VRVAYTSTSRALAVLELLVHVTREAVPDDTVLIPIEIPDHLVAHVAAIPKDWNDYPYPESTRAEGDRWVRGRSSTGLLVPSAVLRREKNLLINPTHAEFGKIRVHEVEEDGLDRRLFGLNK